MESVKRMAMAVGVAMLAGVAFAFQPIPKASARALGVTRGKSFSKGLVFVNGKCLPPPYVVERWGTGIRINSTPVTGQIVDWNEFLKTQSGVKVVRTEPEPSVEPEPESEAQEPTNEVQQVESARADVNSLDDLFDDDSDENDVKKKPSAVRPAPKAKVVRKPAPPPKPRATVSYVLEGDFVMNDGSKALLKRVNEARTDIDRILRGGGFICFGDQYPSLSGDNRMLTKLLSKLPELQQQATDENAFVSSAYAAKIEYLNEPLLRELYRNRIDYLKLKRLRTKMNDNLDSLLSGD